MSRLTPLKRARRRNRLAALFIIAAMAAVVALAVYLPQYFNPLEVQTVKTNIPLVNTVLKDDNGRDVVVQTLFAIEIDRETRKSVNDKLLHEEISDIMSGMKLSEIEGTDGVNMINRRVTEELNARLSKYSADSSVYLYDIEVGGRFLLSEPAGHGAKFWAELSNR